MKLYISGASAELDRCKRAIDFARRLGAEVHDWTELVEANPDDPELVDALRADLNAISECDAVVFLTPVQPSIGAWVELGYADAAAPIFASTERSRDRVKLGWLRALDVALYASDEEAVRAAWFAIADADVAEDVTDELEEQSA